MSNFLLISVSFGEGKARENNIFWKRREKKGIDDMEKKKTIKIRRISSYRFDILVNSIEEED
jgi:hypothetical protein